MKKSAEEGVIPVIHKTFVPELKEFNAENRSFLAVASDSSIDRSGDVVDVDGWDLDNFKANPVIPWAHDYHQPPVAYAEEVGVKDGKLLIRPKFATAEEYPFADQIYKLYKGGFLRSFSVGFKPTEYQRRSDENGNYSGYHISKAELLEVSGVVVPANPNANTLSVEPAEVTSSFDDKAEKILLELQSLKLDVQNLKEAQEGASSGDSEQAPSSAPPAAEEPEKQASVSQEQAPPAADPAEEEEIDLEFEEESTEKDISIEEMLDILSAKLDHATDYLVGKA